MARLGAVRIAVCILAFWASVSAVAAEGDGARTPAEIERRRTEIADRLSAIAIEELAMVGLECETTRSALAAERAALEREQAALALARTRNATGPLQSADPPGLDTLDLTRQDGQAPANQATAGQAFNPAFAVIPDVAYYNDDRQGDAFDLIANADGFARESEPGGSDPHGLSHLERGFNLREVELAFSGAVDPYFDVWVTLTVDEDGLEAEEAYVQTRRFLPGLQLRAGRFFSGVGYANKQHPHQWDFVNPALAYDALLGGNLADVGLQLTWLPDLPTYTLIGVEMLQGDNARISQQLSGAYPSMFEETPGPRLFTAFMKIGPDLGYSDALQGGISFGRSRSHQEIAWNEAGLVDAALDGTSWFVGSDWVWRHDSPRPFGRGDLTVQGEYLLRRKDLAPTVDRLAVAGRPPQVSVQDGAYAQVVYGFAQRWTLAGRVDVIGLTNEVRVGSITIGHEHSRRYSAALTFNPTEFSRLRVQYDAAAIRQGRQTSIQQVFVQFQMSLGAHGAHKF